MEEQVPGEFYQFVPRRDTEDDEKSEKLVEKDDKNNRLQEDSEGDGKMSASSSEGEIGNNNSIFREEKEHREDLVAIVKHIFDEVDIPEDFEEWSYEEQRDWISTEGAKKLKDVPDTLGDISLSIIRPADCGRPPWEKPDWLDMEKFRRGQKFAMDHICGIFFANMLALYTVFAFKDGIRSLILTRKSDTPYRSFKRYLSTVNRLRNWYTADPWTKGTSAYNDIQVVRRLHLSLRQHVINLTYEEFQEVYNISNPWCPMSDLYRRDLNTNLSLMRSECRLFSLEDMTFRPKTMNQYDMAFIQFAFVGLIILYPKAFGVHYATKEDLEAFCHVWRGIGYLLGMEDKYNFCKGDLEEVKQRARDMLDFWVKPKLREVTPQWEHMSRCLMEGICYYFPVCGFVTGLMYLMDLMELPCPRIRRSLTLPVRFFFLFLKFIFYYVARLPRVMPYMNKVMLDAVDNACKFSPEQHAKLKKRSAKTLLGFGTT